MNDVATITAYLHRDSLKADTSSETRISGDRNDYNIILQKDVSPRVCAPPVILCEAKNLYYIMNL